LYTDYSKLRVRTFEGWHVTHVDQFIDELLTEDYACDIALPHLPKRWHLEQTGALGPRVNSAAGLDGEEVSEEEAEAEAEPEIVGRLKLKGGKKRRRVQEAPVVDEDRVADGHDLDMDAANALRAKLGMKPLR
jgi:pre-mRNA-splicing factor 38A